MAVALGCDLFDSSAYAKYAADGRMIFPWGTEKLDELMELPCCCPVCTSYSADELKKMEKKEVIVQLAMHNLYVSYAELRMIRAAISEGRLWELVERRAQANPYLYDALHELRNPEHKRWLEYFEPVSKKKALLYTGNHTIHRPIVFRCHQRLLERYLFPSRRVVVFPEGQKPYSRYYSKELAKLSADSDGDVIIDSVLGPAPLALDEMYPFAQSVVPDYVDLDTKKEAEEMLAKFLRGKIRIDWNDKTRALRKKSGGKKAIDWDRRRIAAVADMQFGMHASEALFQGDIHLVKSKKTGKIRNVYVDGKHILSMRATEGLFTLKIAGAYQLHHDVKYPGLRVVVEQDAIPFVRDGKSVFAKFVIDGDPGLRPLDECLVVTEKDVLIAVCRCLLNRDEMLCFSQGVAVKTRETVKEQS